MITRWIRKHSKNFKNVSNEEVRFNCPKCNHPNFYFNTKKMVGFCHRASCHWKPSLSELSDFWRSEPEDAGWTPEPTIEKEHSSSRVSLPESARPVVIKQQECYITQYPDPYNWLKKRNLTPDQIYQWGIHADGFRIYVPVYYQGELVQYVGRYYLNSPTSLPKYTYAKGRSISNFIFGWDEGAKFWDWMTLVENTFVSIWLRDSINCTTNFGSYISSTQYELLSRSKAKEVILLWDEDAKEKAIRTRHALHRNGINSKVIFILKQPDYYPIEFLKEVVNIARSGNEIFYDFTNMCKQLFGIQYHVNRTSNC